MKPGQLNSFSFPSSLVFIAIPSTSLSRIIYSRSGIASDSGCALLTSDQLSDEAREEEDKEDKEVEEEKEEVEVEVEEREVLKLKPLVASRAAVNKKLGL